MGARGPAPTPTAILERRGSWRAATREGEPRPPVAEPAKPRWLPREAAKFWDLVVPQLLALGVLAEIDWSVLAQFCEARAEVNRWRRVLDKEGWVLTTRTKGGGMYKYLNPHVSLINKAREQLRSAEARLGLSPADRTRIRLEPQDDDEGQKAAWWEN